MRKCKSYMTVYPTRLNTYIYDVNPCPIALIFPIGFISCGMCTYHLFTYCITTPSIQCLLIPSEVVQLYLIVSSQLVVGCHVLGSCLHSVYQVFRGQFRSRAPSLIDLQTVPDLFSLSLRICSAVQLYFGVTAWCRLHLHPARTGRKRLAKMLGQHGQQNFNFKWVAAY